MHSIHSPLANRFDCLFNQLLATLEKERALKSAGESLVALVEVKDRLHGLRSELARVRQHLVPD